MSRTRTPRRTAAKGLWGFLSLALEFCDKVLEHLRGNPLLVIIWGIAVLFVLVILITFELAGDLPQWGKVILPVTLILVLGGISIILIIYFAGRHATTELAQPQEPIVPTKKLEDTFQLRYVWLDATTSSFLIANRFDPGLARVLPANPIVIHNTVFEKLREIVTRFGHLEGLRKDPNMASYQYWLQTTTNGSNYVDGKWKDASEAGELRIYAAEEDIIWPDEPALRAVFRTTEWPSNYDMTYEEPFNWGAWRQPEDTVKFQNEAISCVQLHAPISGETLENYWTLMKDLENAITHEELKREGVTNIIFPSLETNQRIVAKHKSIEAMLYFGERGWPKDFLIAVGNASVGGCGRWTEYDYSFGFYARPRKLYTLVAVIEPKGDSIEIQRLRYSVDARQQLRKLRKGGRPAHSPAEVVTIIKKGEMGVVPLRIELRYADDAFGRMTDADAARKVHDRIRSLSLPTVKLTGREGASEEEPHSPPPLQTIFSKSVASFRVPMPPKVTPTYIFGPSLNLSALTIEGTEVEVRAAPADSLNFIGRAPIGSCPFLFVSTGSDDPTRIGRVLIGASRKELVRTEEIKLPQGTRSFFISEVEPKVTYLETLWVKDSQLGIERLIASGVLLRPGEAREFPIPKGLTGEITLSLQGYYEPLHFERFADRSLASSSAVRVRLTCARS
jgi:hypothetical protein